MALDFLRSIWPGSSQPLGGRYEIVEQLGAGGFGQTFRARDLHLPGHPLCVVKQLKPQVKSAQDLAVARRLFDTEAQVLYRLGNHPQIPRLLAHFEQNQEFYLAQELVVGHSLADELISAIAWQEVQVVAFISDLLRTLAFVHDNRVIHRDLKPSNLIRRHHDQRIVLIDFGAVKQASTQMVSSNTGITHTVSIGTQGYMPNEQLGGTPHFSSDVYAVGIIGIQALTGQHPRLLTPDPRTGELDWHHHRPDATPELVAVLDRMVRYDYRARYVTAREAFEAMQTLPETLRQAIPAAISFHSVGALGGGPGHVGPNDHSTTAASSPPDEFESGTALPQTHSEAPLPITQSEPASPTRPAVGLHPSNEEAVVNGEHSFEVEARPPEATAAAASNSAPQSTNHAPSTDVVSPKLPSPSRDQKRASIATSITTAVATQVVPALNSAHARRTLIPSVAIALILGLGLVVWRSCAPGSSGVSNSVVQSGESAGSEAPLESASGAEGDADSAPLEAVNDPKPLAEILQEAQELRQAQDYNQALARYEEAIAQDESSSEAHSGRCYVLNQLQRYQDAVSACDQAIALNSSNAQALWSKGFALEQREQPQAALDLYNQALGYDPNFAEAWNNKGTALLQLGNYQAALAAFDKAIELNPDFAEAWSNRGAALWERRQFREGLSSVERALQLRPDYPEASALRQEMQRRLGQ